MTDMGSGKRTWLIAAAAALLAAPALAQLGTKPADRSWYFGNHVAEVTAGKERYTIRLRCPSGSVCEYTFVRQPAAVKRPSPKRAEGLQALDPDIANKNLAHLREVVKAKPAAYEDEQDGPVLAGMRAVLESDAKFDLCVGLSDWLSPWGRLCRLSPENPRLPPFVLLLPTQGPECKEQIFCEYYFFPMRRPPAAPTS